MWASIESDRQGGVVFALMIVIVVALGVINTLLMSVYERTRELGVMKALGASRSHIVATITWESFWLAFIGVLLGTLIGVGVLAYFHGVGIKFFDEPIEFGGMKLSVIYPRNTLRGSVIYPLAIFFSALIGGLWPAIRASRLKVTDALRHT